MSTALAQRAAHIISQVSPEAPADFVLRREVGTDRELESHEKRALTGAVFAYYRWLAWLDTARALPQRVLAALDLQKRFDADPASIKPEALVARTLPAWALDSIDFPTPEARVACLRQLQRPPSLWIRPQREFAASLARALRHTAPPDLAASGFKFQPSGLSSLTALRYTGPSDLFKSDEFKKGLFEIQDLASQLIGHACAPDPGSTWWDACCGEGGKTLHLSDLMANKGVIWATDRHTGRLATLRKRAARARAFNYRAVTWNGGPFLPTKTKFDGILVDAPCSGVGTWQRNPHARWTLAESDVRELAEIQLQLLENTHKALKPGGVLIYAVCTITRQETTDVVRAFGAAHPELEPAPLPGLGRPESSLFLWPHELDANGMFLAAWRRK
ncbi:MAG: RsmB/NOP family class I SAM-dependent RNA methyltransferase [Opitutaceae bacterium]|jgi:16S rRNA (cytosine967-C5)-methyltransferase|nr:RsmB/NOP family class I SAM-dependent RNA methyltransferase [Opitutaceae bacterium]